MKNKRILRITSMSVLGVAFTLGLSSCSIPYSNNGVLRTYSSTDFLADNNSPLNNSFNNSPISTYAQTALYNLTTYQTVGQFSFENGKEETTKDFLTLEGAKAAFVFKDETTATKVDNFLKDKGFSLDENKAIYSTTYNNIIKALKEKVDTASSSTKASDSSSSSSELKEGTDYWVFQRSLGALQFQNGIEKNQLDPSDSSVTINTQTDYYKNAISEGKVYQFIIDIDNQWVDSKGKEKQPVSSKDFERAIESYNLAADLNYNRNGYFLSLIGLDFDKTVGYKDANNSSTSSYRGDDGSIDWTKYDTTNWANKNDSVFTLYIDSAYPYTFGLLSKEYFSALPHTNQEVININLKSGYIKRTDSGTINQATTDWSKIYGSGGLGQFTKDVWFAGSYYISSFTSANLIFQLNSVYMNSAGKDLLDSNTGSVKKTKASNGEKKLKTISIVYGSGTDDTFYELFKSKQNDFLSAVPSSKMSDASKNFKDNGLVPKKIVQATQSNYIAYTPNPYVVSSDGSVKANDYLGNMAKFIYQWNNEKAYAIRAGIAGLINWYQLSLINLPVSGDFQLSATPYGVFNGYYEQISSGNILGGLPRPLSDYKNSTDTILSSGFTLPYYEYTSSNIEIKKIDINQDAFVKALQSYGATTSNPLEFSIKFGEGSFSTNYQNFLNRMKSSIETLSKGLIRVTIVQRLATTPSATVWYNNQSSPLGFSYWSPDYNGVGTWIEADTTLQTKKIKDQAIEGAPSTNAHNSYHTFLSSMVTAVKKMNATWYSNSKKYSIASSSLPTTDPYKDDSRIQVAFSDTTLKAMGALSSTNKTSSSTNNYDEDNATDNGLSPGNRYGLVAIGLVNKLIENGVFDQEKFAQYVSDPSKLLYNKEKPTSYDETWIGHDVIKSGQSESFSKWLGVYAGEGTINALYENTVLDSDYSYIPRSESGVSDKIYSLVNVNYSARVGTQSTNYRDFGWKN